MKKFIILLGLLIFPITLASCGSSPRVDDSVFELDVYDTWFSEYFDLQATDRLTINRPNTNQSHAAIYAPNQAPTTVAIIDDSDVNYIQHSLRMTLQPISQKITSSRFDALYLTNHATTNLTNPQRNSFTSDVYANRAALLGGLNYIDDKAPVINNSWGRNEVSITAEMLERAKTTNYYMWVVFMPLLLEIRERTSGGASRTMLYAFVLVPIANGFTTDPYFELPGINEAPELTINDSTGVLENPRR